MSNQTMNRGGSARRKRRQARGFTLIELMVAMLLGLVVIGGVVSVFLAGQQSYRTNQALGDVQDGSRIAFEMMARDIRDAGLTGCNNNGRIANVLNPPASTGWWSNLGQALIGYTTGQADPAVAFGTTAGLRVAATDSLQLIGAANSGLSVAATPSSSAANFKLNDPSADLVKGDVIIVCDPDHAAIVQITDYNNSNVTVVHNNGNVVSPGNCSKGLGYPTDCSSPNGNGYQFGPNSQVFKLAAVDWFVGNSANAASGSSLYRLDVVNTAGVPTPTAQEMVPNVTSMKIAYHQKGGASFGDATTVTNWALVDATQVTLTVKSDFQRAGTDVKPISRTFTATTTLRNRVN